MRIDEFGEEAFSLKAEPSKELFFSFNDRQVTEVAERIFQNHVDLVTNLHKGRINSPTKVFSLANPLKGGGKVRGGAEGDSSGQVNWWVEVEYDLPFS